MWLISGLCILMVISYWAGFVAPPHPAQYQSKAGFIMFVALTIFSSYFVLQQTSSIDELKKIIEPVPEITDVSFVPELDAFRKLSAQEKSPASNTTDRYWIVSTNLSMDAVIDFYHTSSHYKGWHLDSDEKSYFRFSRNTDKLLIYITEDGDTAGSKILYTLSQD